jgi:hypothetical protein
MPALHHRVAVVERQRYHQRLPRERAYTTLLTTWAGAPRHQHCGVFLGETGDGYTDPGPDGHVHEIRGLDVLAAGGHLHELSTQRCPRVHNFDPTHGPLHR